MYLCGAMTKFPVGVSFGAERLPGILEMAEIRPSKFSWNCGPSCELEY